MNKRSLLNKTLTQFIVCIAVLLILTTPLFYLLTKYYYAEDMIDIIEAVKLGKPILYRWMGEVGWQVFKSMFCRRRAE